MKNMRNLCEAYIELAYVNVSQFKNETGTVKYFILISRRYETITGLSCLNWPVSFIEEFLQGSKISVFWLRFRLSTDAFVNKLRTPYMKGLFLLQFVTSALRVL